MVWTKAIGSIRELECFHTFYTHSGTTVLSLQVADRCQNTRKAAGFGEPIDALRSFRRVAVSCSYILPVHALVY